jgi:hypothetical protein
MCGFVVSDDEEGEGPLGGFGFVEDRGMIHDFEVHPHFQ